MKTREEAFAGLTGLFNIVMTPFNVDGSLDAAALSENIGRVVALGYNGILVGGTYGEFATMTPQERAELFRAAAAVTDLRLPLMMCVASSDVRIVLELTELAVSLGGIPLVTAPFVSEVTDDQIKVFFQELCARSGVGIVIYNAPGIGVTLSPAAIETICAVPGIVGLKQGDLAPMIVDQLVGRLSRKLRLLCASDLHMPGAVAAGFEGLTSTNSGAFPELIRDNYDAFVEGDLATARRLYSRWYPYREFARRVGQPQTVKAAMRIKGWKVGSVRAPLLDLTSEQYSDLEQIIMQLETNIGHHDEVGESYATR
jgi:dihydrodipicolinate synthase/N-acetylneuraminate lyase